MCSNVVLAILPFFGDNMLHADAAKLRINDVFALQHLG